VCRKHDWFSRVRWSDCSGCRAGRGRPALEWRGGKGDLLATDESALFGLSVASLQLSLARRLAGGEASHLAQRLSPISQTVEWRRSCWFRGRRCTQHEFVFASATMPMDPLLSESLEATAMKNVLAQFGESERDLREAVMLTL